MTRIKNAFSVFVGVYLCLLPMIAPQSNRALAEERGTLSPASPQALETKMVRIPMPDDIKLFGIFYSQKGRIEPAPLVVFLNPWAGGSWVYHTQAAILVEKGFVVLGYNLRGWAGSGGDVDSGGPQDMADIQSVLDWISLNPKVDANRIGIAGVSLGGGVALLSAAYDPRIKAVAAMSGWTDLYSPIYGYNTKRPFWDTLLFLGSIIGSGSPRAARMDESYRAIQNGDIEKIREYTSPRSPVSHLERYRENQSAIFVSQNISDFLFPLSDTWDFFNKLETPKKLNIQPGVHGSTEFAGIVVPSKDEVWVDAIDWFERWLKPKGASEAAAASAVEIKFSNMTFQGASTADIVKEQRRYYLKNRTSGLGSLTLHPENSPAYRIHSGRNSGLPALPPLIGPLFKYQPWAPPSVKMENIRFDRAAVYELPTPSDKFTLAGLPKLRLKFRSDQPLAHVVAQLYRLSPDGKWHFITKTPYTMNQFESANAQSMEFDLYGAFEAFAEHDRLILALDTYDAEFLAPREPFQLDLEANGESWIDLPVAQ